MVVSWWFLVWHPNQPKPFIWHPKPPPNPSPITHIWHPKSPKTLYLASQTIQNLVFGTPNHQNIIFGTPNHPNRANVAQWLATGLWIRGSWVQFPAPFSHRLPQNLVFGTPTHPKPAIWHPEPPQTRIWHPTYPKPHNWHPKPPKQNPCSPMVGHRALDQGVVGSIPGAVQ